MRRAIFGGLGVMLTAAIIFSGLAPALALTPDEVIRLKKAGVSDATIQRMLEQEKAGGASSGPVSDEGGAVVYSAGQDQQGERQRNKAHERWKEKKSMDALKGVIIDQRTTN